MTTHSKAVPFGISFFRHNATALMATAVDAFVLIVCREIFIFPIVWSAFVGAVCGAIVAFFLGRHWAYASTDHGIGGQSLRFAITVAGSILLNTYGVYVLSEVLRVGHYTIAKLVTAIAVGFCFNFPMQRYFVFR
ncbi:MAG: GtrA family protein [Bacteroidota bacterium]